MLPATSPRRLGFISALFGCAAATLAQPVRPVEDRIDAIVDHGLVVPVEIADDEALTDDILVRLDDGRVLGSELVLLHPAPMSRDDAASWTARPIEWRVVDAKNWTPETPPGSWLLLIDLPVDAVGQGIWIERTRFEPNWLPDPKRVSLESGARDAGEFWAPALTEDERRAPMVERAIQRLRASPLQRWRARLMTRGLSPTTAQRTRPSDTDRDLDAIYAELHRDERAETLERIARYISARWRLILGRLWLHDPDAAERLKSALTRTARAAATTVPLWPDDRARLEALAHDLLSPYVDDALRVERVDAWLAAQPRVLAWVVDDAGAPLPDAPALTPTIGAVLLRDAPGPVSARLETRGAQPAFETIEPGAFTTLTIARQTERAFARDTLSTHAPIRLRVDARTTELRVQSVIPTVTPPGATLGPLVRDWTLGAFRAQDQSRAALPPPDRRVRGILTRIASPTQDDHRVGWRIHLETGAPPEDAEATLRLWIGPRNAASAVWTVSSRAGLIESRVDPDIPSDPGVRTATDDGRWVVSIDIPPGAIDDSGILLLGIDRELDGIRAAWPRRMMPWDDEPGRAAFDLTGWIGAR